MAEDQTTKPEEPLEDEDEPTPITTDPNADHEPEGTPPGDGDDEPGEDEPTPIEP
jgi:hypothetical protein